MGEPVFDGGRKRGQLQKRIGLDAQQIRVIFVQLRRHFTLPQIARAFGIHHTTVLHYLRLEPETPARRAS